MTDHAKPRAVRVEDLSVFAGDTRLLGPVSFDIEAGGTLVIMGETGAGKSLIAQAILGALPNGLHMEGQIAIDGNRVESLTPERRAALWGKDIATLPQEPWRALDPLMRASPQVNEAHRFVAGYDSSEARRQTAADFETLGLVGSERRLPGTLSGGMAQRVAFAAATAGRADILLADEPTKGLDATRHDRIVRLLKRVPEEGGTLLAITHEAAVARALGGMLVILKDGSVVEEGPAADVLAAPQHPYSQELLAADPASWPRANLPAIGDAILTAENLAVARGTNVLVDGFGLTVHASERIAVTGSSGVGKSSLLDVLAGLLKPARGSLHRSKRLHPTSVQKLYQDPPAAFPPYIPLGRTLQDVARLHRVDWSTMMDYLQRLSLHPSLLERKPNEVSGGELQRISIARALAVRPEVILA
ncbi:MAG: ATP-binding cassette domain-containing protein, partial [Pseudomonadota bacterium]